MPLIEAAVVQIKVGSTYPPALWEVNGWKCPICGREWLEEKDGGVNICHCGFNRLKKYLLEEYHA